MVRSTFLPATSIETRSFLMTVVPSDANAARRLWDGHSGARGLLDARVGSTGGRRGFRYNPRSDTFTRAGTGREVTPREMQVYVRRVSAEAQAEMQRQTRQLIEGTIVFAVWYSQMRSVLRALYYTLWTVSIGGFLFDDDTQRRLFYLFVLSQFQRFDNFAMQVLNGSQSLTGAFYRAGLYGRAGNAMYQNMLLHRRKRQGYREGRRVLGENENHCHDSADRSGCVELEELGWMPIERIVPIGDATCYSNCLCMLEFRR